MDALVLSQTDGIATIRINRPQQRNAITFDMWQELPDLCSRLEQRPEIHVVIVVGTGEEAFSAGADIEEFAERRSDPWRAKVYNGKVEMALKVLSRLPKPTIALVKGYCFGGGLLLAAHCDIRIAAHNARFGLPAAKLATVVGYRELERLIHLIGTGHALDLLLTARTVDAPTALAMGLCSRLFSLEAIDGEVDRQARQMVELAPLAQRWHKQMVHTLLSKPDLLELTPEESMLPDACFDTRDYAEGIRAFLEKREPLFRGK